MLLLDSLYINNSGGKILLDYLVQELEKANASVYYLFDERCSNDYANIPKERKEFLKASLFARHAFYKRNGNNFSKVFCFGNLGPTIKLNVPVYVYFHQRLFLSQPSNLVFKQKLQFKIKSFLFKAFLKNVDEVWLQTENIKSEFCTTINSFNKDNVRVLPFFETLNKTEETMVSNSFIYVSNMGPHKNHLRLIEAFVAAYDELKVGELVLTISEQTETARIIDELKQKGYPIRNLGFIERQQLANEYKKAAFTIYPSLSESFGLGIIEAIESGCKVIGADLPYMYAVCEPSLVFDPFDNNAIKQAIITAVNTDLKPSKQHVFNKIDIIINRLKT